MNGFKISLKNFRAIQEAGIDLSGITVLSGINASGKSTIAKLFYWFVYYTLRFDYMIDNQILKQLNEIIFDFSRALRFFNMPYIAIRKILPSITHDLITQSTADFLIEDPASVLFSEINKRIEVFVDELAKIAKSGDKKELTQWLENNLDAPIDNEDYLEQYRNQLKRHAASLITNARRMKKDRSLSDLFSMIEEHENLEYSLPESLRISENNIDLIQTDRFRPPFDVENIIYIDTPIALSNNINTGCTNWYDLRWDLEHPKEKMPESAKKIVVDLRRLIRGNIVLKKPEFQFDIPELRYVGMDGIDIPVEDTATGMKTFAYMLRLLENGYLTDKSILIIDEPEVHLHPQWIVEFARILVALNKEVGTKILLASHNPDMVAALKSIADANEMQHAVRFYLGKLNIESNRFIFEDQDNSINNIFESFNIALERIKTYGVKQ